MRLFVEDDGKLYELVAGVGCKGCEWDPLKSLDKCWRKDECKCAADFLFGHFKLRHWKEISMG